MPAFVKYELAVLLLFFIATLMFAENIPQNPPAEQTVVQQTEPSVEALFDIPKIAGKTENEVEALLGEPVFCAKPEATLNCAFKENEIEIVFIDGKADWITVYSTFRNPSYRQKLEGKTKTEVLKLLGDPVFCAKSKSSLHCSFLSGEVNVEFIGEKVEEVVVKGNLGAAPYSKDILAMLGLPVKDATFSNNHVMRWENIAGLLSVTLHSEGGAVSLVAIKAKSK